MTRDVTIYIAAVTAFFLAWKLAPHLVTLNRALGLSH